MQIEAFRVLLAEVGPLVPCRAITEFDQGSSWVVTLDEGTFLLLDWLESTRRVMLHADIGQLPETGRSTMLERLLRYDTTWRETGGLRVALDSDDTLTLVLDLPRASLDAWALRDMLANFATAVDAWKTALGDARPSRRPRASPPSLTRSTQASCVLDLKETADEHQRHVDDPVLGHLQRVQLVR
jgi:hypothetical protein